MSQLNLFGEHDMPTEARIVGKAKAFTDYDAFVAKFNNKAPKTTDDCYTPQHIYDAILEWLRGEVDIEGRPIVRPFYPGGDIHKTKRYMTAKELKEALANVPDDAEVLISVHSEDLGCDVPCPTHKVVKNCDKNIVIV